MQLHLIPESRFARQRFIWLLAAILVVIVFLPVFHELSEILHLKLLSILIVSFLVAILGTVVISISERRVSKAITVLLGFPAFLCWVLPDSLVSYHLETIRHLLAIAFLTFAIVMILKVIFAAQQGTFNLICASLCVYLFFGCLWALAYSTVGIFDGNAFSAEGRSHVRLRMGLGHSAEALYFSFTTLTTLGYGDIVPKSPTTRMLATLEAIVGQLYLAVLVARLVGMHIVDSDSKRKAKTDSPSATSGDET